MLCCIQGGQGPGGQQDLLAKLAQAAAAHPHLQRAVPSANARTLDDIEAAVRGSAPPGGLLKAFQQKAQGAKPGNALLSLLQGSAGPPNAAFGQVDSTLHSAGILLCPSCPILAAGIPCQMKPVVFRHVAFYGVLLVYQKVCVGYSCLSHGLMDVW